MSVSFGGQNNVECHQLHIHSVFFHHKTNNFNFFIGKKYTLHKLTISNHMVNIYLKPTYPDSKLSRSL